MDKSDARTGLLLVYTGEGKGKTTAALGMALRTIGHGGKAFVAQFLKGRPDTGECLAAAHALPDLVIRQFGRPDFVTPDSLHDTDYQLARAGLAAAADAISSGEYRLVILDEVNVALSFGLLRLDEVLTVVGRRPPAVSIVLTGRGAPDGLCRAADLVSEVREVKHPFSSGIPAQPGIDY